jgi:protocatechuate 3,4-dioxygenase, beta subunit
MMKAILFIMLFVITMQHTSCGQHGNKQLPRTNKSVGGGCDGCDIMYTNMPTQINEVDTSYGWNQKGEKMKVEGTVYLKDGKTPAANIIIYYWQTNADGLYAPSLTDKTRHGAIRGWMKTGADGKYTIYTIKPASYPKSSIPAHIHYLIKEPDLNEYYIDDIYFEGDPFVTEAERKKLSLRCGSGIVELKSNSEGMLYCKRDIILGLNVPDYPED